uniref:NADH-ubiquinone oxidoreductase chain 6 n=1 Tax=Leptomantella albella TaxID=627747 RepID=X5CWW3_LEPAB|nr:NADH dehydrogenase subunit 6 [Leptomantella albella]AHW52371.1 NADH dehydrogenase subunit 6 [Leptomantella albella]
MLSIIFLFLNHPLSMGLVLFLQTILMCLISGLLSTNFWFSYILLLIYIGGMLVLFMYITSLASNEMFFYSNKMLILLLLTPLILITVYWLNSSFNIYTFENLENINSTVTFLHTSLLKMYNQPINKMTIMIAGYLFLTLIAVVKMININKGPLRQMNN